jgi:uncharacterized protein (TIGR02594 family)
MNTGLKLYNHALGDFGLSEVSGPGSNARIKMAIKQAAEWLDQDDSKTAWCGCMMGLWFSELGLEKPKEFYRAANWKTVGKKVLLSEAKQGDVVVMSRTGGKHVALFSKQANGLVYLLGGNQRNQVNVSAFNEQFVEEVRRID